MNLQPLTPVRDAGRIGLPPRQNPSPIWSIFDAVISPCALPWRLAIVVLHKSEVEYRGVVYVPSVVWRE